MSRNFTFRETGYIRTAACILLLLNTGCSPMAGDAGYDVQLSANQAANSHLKSILFSRNRDSIVKCAEADYTAKKYYTFWAATPGEVKFNNYLVAYARQKYKLILVNCGCKNRVGAYYYNNRMAELFLNAKLKPMTAIYLEAKNSYNKTLTVD